ncbi:MAG TPA: hypothetical protein VLZ75_11540 [Chitinophagales bacterium]|nr:hypothetical protein [Chitinophagales bacterium]
MNTYIFAPEAKSFLIKGFIIGIVIFIIGIAIKWNVGTETPSHDKDHAQVATTTQTLLAQAETGDTESLASTPEVISEAPAEVTADHAVAHADEDLSAHASHEPTLRTHIIANIYTIVMFAFWIGVAALFFLSATTLALGGWHIQIQKVILSVAGTLPFSIIMMSIFFIFFHHDLFHWTHDLYDPTNPETYDAILDGKRDYLNLTRFGIFAVVLFGMTIGMNYFWNKNLKAMDENPSVKLFDQSRAISAVSIVIIAMFVNTFGSWDWAMSIQPHWYSTMFSWYLLASAAVTMFAIVYLMIIFLKVKNYLPNVNANHKHDIGKYIFAITVFWTYVWFSQYMLMWYANIPEETLYFTIRINGYPVMWYAVLVINFIIPFLVLLSRNSKRVSGPVIAMSILLIVGHWMDFFSMVVPELIPNGGGFNLISLGAFVAISSVFGYISLSTLSKYKDLASTTHPYYQESFRHNI